MPDKSNRRHRKDDTTGRKDLFDMTLKVRDAPCAHCEFVGVFGPSGEFSCRQCNRRDLWLPSSQYPKDLGGNPWVWNQTTIRQIPRKGQSQAQAKGAPGRRVASLLTLFVALMLIVLALAGMISDQVLLLALAFCALALTHLRGI